MHNLKPGDLVRWHNGRDDNRAYYGRDGKRTYLPSSGLHCLVIHVLEGDVWFLPLDDLDEEGYITQTHASAKMFLSRID
jgi:hypothetical protein